LYYNFSKDKTINPFIGLGVSANHLKSSVEMTLEGYLKSIQQQSSLTGRPEQLLVQEQISG
jgi:hypothetical protein